MMTTASSSAPGRPSGGKRQRRQRRRGRSAADAAHAAPASISTSPPDRGEALVPQVDEGSGDEKGDGVPPSAFASNGGGEEGGESSSDDDDSDSDSDSDGSDDDDDSSSEEDDDSGSADDDSNDGDGDRPAIGAAEVRRAVALASEAAAKTFGWETKPSSAAAAGGKGVGNALSEVIPGYTAPLRLQASTEVGGGECDLASLRRKAEQTDAATLRSSAGFSRGELRARAASAMGRVGDPRTGSALTAPPSAYKTGARKRADPAAGSGWFGFTPSAVTDELRTDLALLRNRSYLDPKRFYKKADAVNARMVQVGTVVEGAGEYFSSRLSKKERRSNFAEEVMADGDVAGYAKKQYAKMQRANEAKRKVGYKGKKTRGERGMSKRRRMGY